MITVFYDACFALSLLLGVVYACLWHRHYDVHITLIFLLVPVTNLAYVLLTRSNTLGEALNANRLSYLGGCYLQLFLMLVIFSLCDIPLKRWVRVTLLALSTVVYLSALTIGESRIFYRSIRFARENGAVLLTKDYNWMHTVFYVLVAGYFALSVGAIVYSYFRKNQVSRKTIYLLFLTELAAMLSFFGGRLFFKRVELLPAFYDFALVIYLIIVRRMCLYDVAETAVDALIQTDDTGIVSFDFQYNYLGSNDMAKRVFPELNELTVDLPVRRSERLAGLLLPWLEGFQKSEAEKSVSGEEDEQSETEKNVSGEIDKQGETEGRIFYEQGGGIYEIFVNWLFDGRHKRGLQILIDDDTKDQQRIRLQEENLRLQEENLRLQEEKLRLQESYNSDLKRDVAAATEKLEGMHDRLILGMAAMVESRDNSTGGHIRRTSEGVRLLIDALRADPETALPDEFCRRLIKAAPMHDLGKIAVDDAVLRKPGRFEPWEFEEMKTHAAEGARIVREILKGTDDAEFRRIAENVAHYHHERWDGSGYPERLRGEEIPFEARIMAIADVYDALVSKRVYKEKMPPEKANAIILEGMGTQFDPGLERYYLAARPALEEYYAGLD